MSALVPDFKRQLTLLPLSWSPELSCEKFDTLRQTCCEEARNSLCREQLLPATSAHLSHTQPPSQALPEFMTLRN